MLYKNTSTGTHFQRLSRPQGTWFCRKESRKKSQVTPPGIDPGTLRLVAQRFNYYATPGPTSQATSVKNGIVHSSYPLNLEMTVHNRILTLGWTQPVTTFRFWVAAPLENPASHIRCGKRKKFEHCKFIQQSSSVLFWNK